MTRIPEISFIEAVILASLMRSDCSAHELRSTLQSEYLLTEKHPVFFRRMSRLAQIKLVDIDKLRTSAGSVRQRSLYSITEDGRKYFNSTVKFISLLDHTFLGQDGGEPQEFASLPKPVMNADPKRTVRIASPDERAKIMKSACPEFATIYAVAIEIDVPVTVLSQLDIECFDSQRGTITIPGREVGDAVDIPLTGDALKNLNRSTRSRRTGRIFLTPTGNEWSETNLRQSFTRLRKKLELDDDVVLQIARIRRKAK